MSTSRPAWCDWWRLSRPPVGLLRSPITTRGEPGIAGLDRLDRGDDEVDRLLGAPGLARVADRPERPVGEGHGVEEQAGVGRADRERPERRGIDLRGDEERLGGVRARPRPVAGGSAGPRREPAARPGEAGLASSGGRSAATRQVDGGRGCRRARRAVARRARRAERAGSSTASSAIAHGPGRLCRSVSSSAAPPGPQAHRRPGLGTTAPILPETGAIRARKKMRWPAQRSGAFSKTKKCCVGRNSWRFTSRKPGRLPLGEHLLRGHAVLLADVEGGRPLETVLDERDPARRA